MTGRLPYHGGHSGLSGGGKGLAEGFPIPSLDHITLLNVRLHLKAGRTQLKSRRRPYTVRRNLSAALKNSICAFSPSLSCFKCVLAENCPYTRILLPAASMGSRGRPAPRPVIFRPGPAGEGVDTALRTTWDLIVVGTGWKYLKYILRTLSGRCPGRDQCCGLWGVQGIWELQQAMLVHPQGKMPLDLSPIHGQNLPAPAANSSRPLATVPPHMIIWGNTLAVAPPKVQGKTPAGERGILRLHFKTRTRLKRRGRYLTRPPQFSWLVRHLLRRTAALSAWYAGRSLTIDWHRLMEEAAKVQLVDHDLRWSRWGRSPSRVMYRSGFTGSVYYQGPWQPFSSLLALGTYVHVGQGTTFGGGQFTAQVE